MGLRDVRHHGKLVDEAGKKRTGSVEPAPGANPEGAACRQRARAVVRVGQDAITIRFDDAIVNYPPERAMKTRRTTIKKRFIRLKRSFP